MLLGGLTVQRPVKRAIEQDDERVRKWKLEEFVAAVAEAVEVDRKRRKQIPDVQEAKQLMGKLTKREVQILRLLSRGLLIRKLPVHWGYRNVPLRLIGQVFIIKLERKVLRRFQKC